MKKLSIYQSSIILGMLQKEIERIKNELEKRTDPTIITWMKEDIIKLESAQKIIIEQNIETSP